ncbi:MAG: hydratase, partial [Lachnospiraceae bacterium]|nr:hydratase [Lachnospiraceae bacterium]
MITLLKNGAYVVNGEVIEDTAEGKQKLTAMLGSVPAAEEAKKATLSYGILEAHNTSGSMDKLKIKFDKLTSHDIKFVG